MVSNPSVALVIEERPDRLRSALFVPVERQMRLIGLAECAREESLSVAVESLAQSLAQQTGMTPTEIQRDPIFVVTHADALAATSVRMVDRRQAIAAACQSLAHARDVPVVALEHDVERSEIVVISAESGQPPQVVAHLIADMDSLGVFPDANLVDAARSILAQIAVAPELVILPPVWLTQPDGVVLLAVADMLADLACGTVVINVDTDQVMTFAGALDSVSMESVLQHDLLPYGTVVRARGATVDGVLAIRGVVESGDRVIQRFSVPWGCVQHIATPAWHAARVRLAMLNGASVDGESRREIQTGFGSSIGRGGLFLDARQAPTQPVSTDLNASWLIDAGADPAQVSQ